jgi:hypothetical protein
VENKMINIKLIINQKTYYAICSDESNKQKSRMGITWADLLHHLENVEFPEEHEINEDTKNSHVIDLSESLDGLKFLIFTFKNNDRKMFSVFCNEKITSIKKKPFNKWQANLSCGHSFLMDSSIDDPKDYRRVFCSKCLEEYNA